jgi:hypothetical protein
MYAYISNSTQLLHKLALLSHIVMSVISETVRIVFELTQTDPAGSFFVWHTHSHNKPPLMIFVILLCFAAAVQAADPFCTNGIKHPDAFNPSCCAQTCGPNCGAA